MTNTLQNNQKNSKKVLKGIIIAIFIFISLSMTATKLVYDYIFKGYDGKECAPEKTNLTLPPREEYYYMCGNETMYGFRLKARSHNDNIIIIAPGFNACADEYLPLAQYFIPHGYDVFLFDCVGSGNSTGTYVGFPQEITDLSTTLDFVNDMGYKNIFLLGHSRGGYAVCCNLNGNVPIAAAVSISGVNSAMDGLMSSSVNAVGKAAYINYPFLWAYQNELFGQELANMNAAKELSKTGTPALIIHGAGDTDIPKDKYSIYSHRKHLRNRNVKFSLYENPGHDGHTNILFENETYANKEIMEQIDIFFKSHCTEGGL